MTAMSILPGKATQPIITPERIDKNRYRAPLFFGAIAVAAAMFSIPMFLTGSTTTALAMIYLAVFIVSYAVSSWCLKYFLSAGRTYWSHDSHQVVMTTPPACSCLKSLFHCWAFWQRRLLSSPG